mgnify:CR=1 FL=1
MTQLTPFQTIFLKDQIYSKEEIIWSIINKFPHSYSRIPDSINFKIEQNTPRDKHQRISILFKGLLTIKHVAYTTQKQKNQQK